MKRRDRVIARGRAFTNRMLCFLPFKFARTAMLIFPLGFVRMDPSQSKRRGFSWLFCINQCP